MKPDQLAQSLRDQFDDKLMSVRVERGEVTVETGVEHQLEVCRALRDTDGLEFTQLIDLCGMDYLVYGKAEWETDESTGKGFSRGVEPGTSGRLGVLEAFADMEDVELDRPRFAVVLHLLSVAHNHRVRVRVYATDDHAPVVKSVTPIWNSADWFEREAFDLYGIMFEGHPDLRRILTDYGFVGHPFRKDFPLSGNVEVRYDAEKGRVIYQPVTIEPRVLVPKVIREAGKADDESDQSADPVESDEVQADA